MTPSDEDREAEVVQPPLPVPDDPDLERMLSTAAHVALYGYLYSRRDDPPTMNEIRAFLAAQSGGTAPAQTDRRVRDLRDLFDIEAVVLKGDHRYRLRGWSPVRKDGMRKAIGSRIRALVLAPQRCAQCGRTPLEDHIKLVVDHKLPREWGGSDAVDNLQPLCQDCNEGKKAFYATYHEHAELIRAAAGYESPHERIGELLKAFKGDWVPSDLISIVASLGQYQEDWRRRLRELRVLGWVINSKRKKDALTGRTLTWYRVAHWKPWPDRLIRSEIDRLKKLQKNRNEQQDQ